MNKKQKVISITNAAAAEVVATCIQLYNDDRTLQKVHLELSLEDLGFTRITESTKALVITVLRNRGIQRARYDHLTRAFRGYLTFTEAVFDNNDPPIKPITLKTPPLRTCMGELYLQRPM